MGLFSRKNETEEEKKTPRNPNNLVTFRVVAIAYVAYLCFNMVKLYAEGGPDAPSLTTLIIGLVVLGGGAAFMAFVSYREWKRGKVEYDQYMAELRAEAEAKRALEEAEEAEAELEDEADEYYEEDVEDEEDETSEETEEFKDTEDNTQE